MEISWQFRDDSLVWHDCSKEDAVMANSHGHEIRPKPGNYMAEIKRDYLEKQPPTPPLTGSQSSFQEEYQIKLDWLDSQK